MSAVPFSPQGETHVQRRLVAGRYRLVRELGRGGMGVVWLAEDQLVGRQVAVKELRPPQGPSQAERQTHGLRALQEARSAARIDHPGAVTLYDVLPPTDGDDAVYLIMELVEGPTLAQLMQSGPLPALDVARFGLQLLAVLQVAHGLGVVHRDIKPANIIIAAGGQAKLTDFGIAYTMGDARLTRSGIMGTQAYMAPELFESVPITPAADLWSLGATLFAAAEGRGPFERDTAGATLRAILIDDPPVPRCGSGLATAITGMLQRDPAHRATIDQAHDALLRATTQPPTSPPPGQPAPWETAATTRSPSPPPVLVPPHGPAPPAAPGRRRRDRHRLVVAAVAAAALVVTTAVVVPVLMLRTGPGSAHDNLASGSSPVTLAVPGGSGGNTEVNSVAFSPDSKTLAVADFNGDVYLWAVATGHIAATLTSPAGSASVDSVAFSPDGTMLAAGNGDGSTYLWDVATHRLVATLNDPGSEGVNAVAFSPDGQTLATGDADDSTYLWDVATDRVTATLTDPSGGGGQMKAVAFSPDGQTLATGDNGGSTYLWNVATHHLVSTLADPSGSGVNAVAFSPDSETVAAADTNGSTYLWAVATGRLAATLTDPGTAVGVYGVAFSPDGKTLATGDIDNSAYLWDVATRGVVATHADPATPGAGTGITSVAFSPDGKTLATGNGDNSAYLWPAG
jgi:serine/threonine protein kinase/sugar lactone lactonase YvrE